MTKISLVILRTAAVASCALLIFYSISSLLSNYEWRQNVSFWGEKNSFDWSQPREKPDLDKEILFFNRIPKTGSEMFVLLMTWLQRRNSFTHLRLRSNDRNLTPDQQLSLVSEMKTRMQAAAPAQRVSFDRHLHFTDFAALGVPRVSYFSMVREPIEKLTSRFYYARATPRPLGYTPPGRALPPREPPPYATLEECVAARHPACTFERGRHYDLTIAYFCGHAPYCTELSNEAAYEEAERNLVRHFSVVGVLEELNATLALLENKLPKYFSGVTELYHQDLGAPHLNKNYQRPQNLSSSAEAELRANLSLELRFYETVRDRLLHQASQLYVH
ncbi:heparan sulfate 2-O-sulfotransferase pipe-like isoform X3 [Hyalella azteca]|uniref:Heparan sulfate 2-O-sulfotransferase pipe-like isoform X3 n=1 Tax=Hyalella azteca TaxID=294128 RepID=A0A8B7P3B2_HYAAZ|nr:heparan sulfate 2-O-sulfotransferase pipe-like isoform X3 [Hyalella azteca]